MEAPYSAITSNNIWVGGKDYDTSATINQQVKVEGAKVLETLTSKSNDSNIVPIVLGSRDGGLPSLTSAY